MNLNPISENLNAFIKWMFLQMIEEHIEDFLAYLDINRSMFFSSEFEIYIFFFVYFFYF